MSAFVTPVSSTGIDFNSLPESEKTFIGFLFGAVGSSSGNWSPCLCAPGYNPSSGTNLPGIPLTNIQNVVIRGRASTSISSLTMNVHVSSSRNVELSNSWLNSLNIYNTTANINIPSNYRSWYAVFLTVGYGCTVAVESFTTADGKTHSAANLNY